MGKVVSAPLAESTAKHYHRRGEKKQPITLLHHISPTGFLQGHFGARCRRGFTDAFSDIAQIHLTTKKLECTLYNLSKSGVEAELEMYKCSGEERHKKAMERDKGIGAKTIPNYYTTHLDR